MTLTPVIRDLTIILSVAATVTFIFRRIKQPVILGYIIAGFLVKPHFIKSTNHDLSGIQVWAELGIIFLMFSLGLEFSFRRLMRVGSSVAFTQIFQLVGMILIGLVGGHLLGWNKLQSIFLGCALAISSTSIIVKSIQEFQLKERKFVDFVYGILVLQDLAAIIMLVTLNHLSTAQDFIGVTILETAARLLFVVCLWFVVGMFFVPKLIKSVKTYGSDEILTIVSISLCLILVTIASYFGYSVALGAFIMGAILGESQHSHQISKLITPLKDLFAAIFFVAVGMLIDMSTISVEIGTILALSLAVVVGNFVLVSTGMLLSGHSVKASVQTALSLGQIGEFSFIIATLGASQNLVKDSFYPIVVGVSLLTSFISPLLMKYSEQAANSIVRFLPEQILDRINQYGSWKQNRSINRVERSSIYRGLTKWCLNGVLVATIFTLASDYLVDQIEVYSSWPEYAPATGWLVAFLVSLPSLGGMFYSFRHLDRQGGIKTFSKDAMILMGQVVTVGFVGIVSMGFFPAYLTLMVTLASCMIWTFLFRKRIESAYVWLEDQFSANFSNHSESQNHQHMAPWDAHLAEFKVHHKSFMVGNAIASLHIREEYGLNIVMIIRGGEFLVAPGARERIFPEDMLLVFGTDEEISRFREIVDSDRGETLVGQEDYQLKRLVVPDGAEIVGKTIRDSGIRERYGSIVVGVERSSLRLRNPKPDFRFFADDIVWVVGSQAGVRLLSQALEKQLKAA